MKHLKKVDQLKWIESDGGPFVMLPSDAVNMWKGIDSDHYDIACEVSNDEINSHEMNGTKIIFLGDEPAITAYQKTDFGICIFRWIYGTSRKSMEDNINSSLYDLSPNNQIESIRTLDSGSITIFDSAMSGNDLDDESKKLVINLKPSTLYGISYEWIDLDEKHKILVNNIFEIDS